MINGEYELDEIDAIVVIAVHEIESSVQEWRLRVQLVVLDELVTRDAPFHDHRAVRPYPPPWLPFSLTTTAAWCSAGTRTGLSSRTAALRRSLESVQI